MSLFDVRSVGGRSALRSAISYFFFNDTATTEIYTLSLHDALPISSAQRACGRRPVQVGMAALPAPPLWRSEEHTSELQSHLNLVCRLLLEKKKKKKATRQCCDRVQCASALARSESTVRCHRNSHTI